MAVERKLAAPEGYDAVSNPRLASFAAQLDDQLARLKKTVESLETRHLEWQAHPGVNTVGMLLAHLAIVEVWWMRLRPAETPEADSDIALKEIIGITMNDDGMPITPDGLHPESLRGKRLADYFRLIDAARESTHAEMRRWRDADLSGTYTYGDRIITREWTVYHVLEHFAGHFGQILLLIHLQRDAKVH